MLIDAGGVNLPNVAETLFAEEMGSYLVGVIAAEQAKKDIIDGKIIVEKTYAGAKAKGLVSGYLSAFDD